MASGFSNTFSEFSSLNEFLLLQLGWFDFDTFDINTYEYYERLENGDLNWIIPNKFIAFSGPEGERRVDSNESHVTFTPSDYVPIFKKMVGWIAAD